MNLPLHHRFPAVSDLEKRARQRMPHFAWEFFHSGTGEDKAAQRNCEAFGEVCFTPRFMLGRFDPEIRTTLFGTEYSAPFGVAPVGMNGLAWPGADRLFAQSAARSRIPFSMSSAATETFETLGPLADGMGWFQLYPPRNSNMRNDMLSRAKDSGFTTLLITVDVPVISRRERQMRAGMGGGNQITPRMAWQAMQRPAWALEMLRNGRPAMKALEKYQPSEDLASFLAFVGQELNGTFDWRYLDEVRRIWDGPLVLKGVLDPAEAAQAVEHGVDGILVSNHGGRQTDGAIASIEALPAVARAVGDRAVVLLDSGVRSGLDVARAIALGADFVLLGRAFMYGVAALGDEGPDHTYRILCDDLANTMSNVGCPTLGSLRGRAGPPPIGT